MDILVEDYKPSKKRKLTFSVDTCCFCKKAFKQNKTTLDPAKFDSLLSACRNKTDEFSANIVASQEKIRNGEIKIAYHKACRSKFCHPFYAIKYVKEDTNLQDTTPVKLTRSHLKADEFCWKEMCFICGDICSTKHRNKWSKVEGSINENSKLYTKLLELSVAKFDHALHSRLLSSKGDLVAVEARYQRKKGCLATYLSDQHSKVKSESEFKKELDIACECLKHELFNSIETEKNVYELSKIKSKVQVLVETRNLNMEKKQLTGKQIKRVLKRVWPELRFISRAGLSDLVCSKSLSIDDALSKSVLLEKSLQAVEEQDNLETSLTENFEYSEEHDLSIIHKAAIILRNRLLKVTGLQNEYYSSSEINTESQKNFLDTNLMLFVKWLSGDTDETNIEKVNLEQKVLSICSDITYLVKPVPTPKHLGLSVYLHHCYGSKKLIEDLHTHGYTLSYTEVRHFLTSAALHMASVQNQTPSGGLVPSQLAHTGNEISTGDLIIAAADNWDHNENTLSGKRSTHAMTSILVQTSQSEQQVPNRVPRVPERSIEVSSLPGRGLAHTLVYKKPENRPSPVLEPPVKPGELNHPEPEDARLIRLKELLYTVGRHTLVGLCDDRAVPDTVFPSWTVFQSSVQDDSMAEPVNIAFNPIIMAPPNNLNTVYTVLKRTKEQMNALGQSVCPIVFDMGLLSKALEIVWANPKEFEGVYPLEGGMDFMMSVFGGIGYIYGDAGLKQMLVESDVFARVTAEHILSGKDFDRALRGILMVDEVLNQRLFYQFLKWNEDNAKPIPPEMLDKFKHLDADFAKNDEEVQSLLHVIQSDILPLIEVFRSEGRASSPLFRFWDDYLSNVSLPIKLYLASSRHGLWHAHQYAKTKLLPFLFSSNRTVYSRFMPYIVLQNNRLPTELVEKFREGKFVAKLTNGSFNSVWYDYILEVTENKALKSSGGIIGLTHNDSALTRWFLARPVTAKYAMAYSSSKPSSSVRHHTDTPFHIQSYNTAVKNMLCLFESETFIDPFSLSFPPSRLVNIASGVEMSPGVENSLLNCHKTGMQSLNNFVCEKLVAEDGESPAKKFFDPLPKSKVVTLGSTKYKGRSKSNYVPIDGEDMNLRLLAINSFKKVPLDRVLSFENAHVPLSLFTDDGSFMSSKKFDFLEKLESLIDLENYTMNASNEAECFVFDAMAVVQMLQPQSGMKTTYHMMALSFWLYILAHRHGASHVHVVFDRYISGSLKTQTRRNRGENVSESGPVAIQPNMVVGDWKRVLSSTKSKCELTRLYTRYLSENCHEFLDDNTTVFVTGGLAELALKITSKSVTYVPGLESDHEEADSRIILHVAHAASLGVQQAVVFSPDTDVFVLLIHHFSQLNLKSLFFKTGRKSIHRDLTRYMCKEADQLADMAGLGTQPFLSHETKAAAFTFVGLLYGQTTCTSFNTLRTVYVLSKKRVKPRKMPPTNDSFVLHLLRCIYQLFIWRSSLNPKISPPDPIDFGYIKDSETGLYIPQLMAQAAAPPELLSDLVCTCSDLCSDDCVCSSNEQPCTQACSCEGNLEGCICENLFTMLANVETGADLEDGSLM